MEEFNVLTDFYFPIKEQEKLYSGKEYKFLKENNIDTAELEGIEKEAEAGEIKFDKEVSDDDKRILASDVLDFVLQLPEDTAIAVLRGSHNTLQFANDFMGFVAQYNNVYPAYEKWHKDFNNVIQNGKAELDRMDKESPLVSKLLAIVGQDAAYTYPIYKKLKKIGVPTKWSLPLAMAAGGTLAFDKSETLLVDSSAVKRLKGFTNIEENTPASEMYDKVFQAFEFGTIGVAFDKAIDIAKAVKNIKPEHLKQADVAVGGAAVAGAVVSGNEAKAKTTSFSDIAEIKWLEGIKDIVSPKQWLEAIKAFPSAWKQVLSGQTKQFLLEDEKTITDRILKEGWSLDNNNIKDNQQNNIISNLTENK
jgi:hypothetical protein